MFPPVRTRRLCQCLRVPKLAAASSKILLLISLSLSPAFKKSADSMRNLFSELWCQMTTAKAVLMSKTHQKLCVTAQEREIDRKNGGTLAEGPINKM